MNNGGSHQHQHHRHHHHHHNHHHQHQQQQQQPRSRHEQEKETEINLIKRNCREKNVLFEDETFPPFSAFFGQHNHHYQQEGHHHHHHHQDEQTIFDENLISKISWMRPTEICLRPEFICDFERTRNKKRSLHIERGGAMKIWPEWSPLFSLISSLTNLTPKLFERIVPCEQTFYGPNYFGLFKFRFWKFGEWIEIIIDDRLPTLNGQLIGLISTIDSAKEFWIPLFEKAFAKFYGSYQNYFQSFQSSISSSSSSSLAQTLQDLTGGITQSFLISQHDKEIILQMISSAIPLSTILFASINPSSSSSYSSSSSFNRLRNGLITKQFYSVVGLARVAVHSKPSVAGRPRDQAASAAAAAAAAQPPSAPTATISHIILIRLISNVNIDLMTTNGEWNGAWSDRSFEWDQLCERDKFELESRCMIYGEFWMSFDDFLDNFTNLDLLHIGPDDWIKEMSLHRKRPWRAVLARRRWKNGYNAGGGFPLKSILKFTMNSQFHLEINENSENKCHVVVSLTQFYDSKWNQNKLQKNFTKIGFCIYEIPSSLKRLTTTFIKSYKPLDITQFTKNREIVTFFTLFPGHFLIVPCTQQPNFETKFLLRILTDEPSNIWEVNDDNFFLYLNSFSLTQKFLQTFVDRRQLQMIAPNNHHFLVRLIHKIEPEEIDAFLLFKIFKTYWKQLNILHEKPTLELCKCLLMLNDSTITGKLKNGKDGLRSLIYLLQFWKSIFTHHSQHHNQLCSYQLRLILYQFGFTISNKVYESLIVRFASLSSSNNSFLTFDNFLHILVKLHISHDRFKNLERKSKDQSVSLEEMILLTIYS